MVLKNLCILVLWAKVATVFGRVKGPEVLFNSKSSEIQEDVLCLSCLVAILKHCNLRKALKIVNK